MIKLSITFFVWNWIVKEAYCYLRNEQLSLLFSVIYFKGEVL